MTIKSLGQEDRPSANALLRLQNVGLFLETRENSNIRILQDICLDIYSGQTVALVGESGSGKSMLGMTCMKLVPGFLKARYTGKALFTCRDGRCVDILTSSCQDLHRIRGSDIGMIFQEPAQALDPLKTVQQTIENILWYHRRQDFAHRRNVVDEVVHLLELVGFKEAKDRLASYPHQLSGGQKQRLLAAAALSCQPRLLIADEPTTALDVTLQQDLLLTLKKIQKERGMAMLFISHNLPLVSRIADRAAVMLKGQIVEENTVHDLEHQPLHDYTRKLWASLHAPKLPPLHSQSAPLLSVKDLSVCFGKGKNQTQALSKVSLEVFPGETLGVVGESGSGKSTLAAAILQLIPYQGAVLFQGKDLSQLSAKRMRGMRQNMQIIFQDPGGALNPRLTIGSILEEGLILHKNLSALERRKAIQKILEEVGLDPSFCQRYPHALSGGQRQRVSIGRALVLEPDFLILDEPTSALDLTVQKEILMLLRNLQSQKKLSYLFITHDLQVVYSMSHRLLLLQKGHIIEQGDTAQVLEHPAHAYTKRLVDASCWSARNTFSSPHTSL